MASGRDDTLRALLASTGSDYSYEALSETEIAALECALGDGFGDVGSIGYQPAPMPSQIKSGLLRHSFYIRENSEYDYEGRPDEFWEWNDDRPPPSEFFPLNFVLRRLRLYFENQLDRLCKSLIQQAPELASLERSELVLNAASRLYEKPWYEFHAVQLIDWIEATQRELAPGKRKRAKRRSLGAVVIVGFSGMLGRLVEQYYWRFRFEKAAVTGAGARAGASVGGRTKAKQHQDQQCRWQRVADQIWSAHPTLSKSRVGFLVQRQLNTPQTAKNITRFIKRP